MLDSFLKVAYETQTREKLHLELVGLMEGLPVVELRKLAEGTSVAELYGHLDKTAFSDEACYPDGGKPKTFLEKFKGTPLFEQAVALEQEELQAEMADTQKRQEERARRATEDSLYDTRDRIRVQKRLLELELAKQETSAAAPPAPATPLPGAPMGKIPPPPPLGGDAPPLPGADPTKVASPSRERLNELFASGDAAGRAFAKTANLGALMGGIKGLASSGGLQKAMSFAAKNPGIVGAGVGAAGGAIAGGPNNRLGGALGGAATGAALGGVGGRMAAGQQLGGAVANTARAGLNTGMRGANMLANKLPGQLSSPVTSAVQGANQAGHDLVNRVAGVGV